MGVQVQHPLSKCGALKHFRFQRILEYLYGLYWIKHLESEKPNAPKLNTSEIVRFWSILDF
jgi:hypothetical protein